MIKRPRVTDGAHLDFIRALPCCRCGDNTATEAAPIRAGNLTYGKRPTGMAEKPADKFVLPMCSKCHRLQHTLNETRFWECAGINPWVLALSLYASSGDFEMASLILERQGYTNGSGDRAQQRRGIASDEVFEGST